MFVCFKGLGSGMPTLPDESDPYLQSSPSVLNLLCARVKDINFLAIDICGLANATVTRGGWPFSGLAALLAATSDTRVQDLKHSLLCFLRLWKNNHVSRKPCKQRSDLVLNGQMRVPK